MTKAKSLRKFNKNLFKVKMLTAGYSRYEDLGADMKPPVSRFRLCVILNKADPLYRLHEIAYLVKSNVPTLFPKKEEVNGA